MNESREINAGNESKVVPRKSSPNKRRFFFATRQASESIGEKENPLKARRDKLNHVVVKNGLESNDSTLAEMIYQNVVSTQKNIVGARSIRRSIQKKNIDIDISLLPSISKESIRMNHTSGFLGFTDGFKMPIRADNTASSEL